MSAPRLEDRRGAHRKGGLDVATARERFAEHLASLHASRNTIIAYTQDIASLLSHLRQHAPAAAADVRAITLAHLQAWLVDLEFTHAASSVARAQAGVRAWARWLVRTGAIESDPTDALPIRKRPRPQIRVMSVEEVSRLVEAPTVVPEQPAPARGATRFSPFVRARDRAMLETLYGSGLRVSELVGLNLRDLDLDRREALVTGKGRRERWVPLGRRSIEAIEAWLRHRGNVAHLRAFDREALFLSHTGTRLHVRNVQRRVLAWGREVCGEDFHPHLLRHACASHMLWGGAQHSAIQQMLGHASPETTTEYTHVSPEFIEGTYERAHPLAKKRKEPKR